PLIQGERFHDLRLGREVFRDRVFCTPQEKRGNPLRKRLRTEAIAVFFDRCAVVPLKMALFAEQAGLCEVKQRPELAELVLNGGAVQGEPILRAQRVRDRRYPGLGVLDRLRLVENDQVVIPREQDVAVELQEWVAGDDYVHFVDQ